MAGRVSADLDPGPGHGLNLLDRVRCAAVGSERLPGNDMVDGDEVRAGDMLLYKQGNRLPAIVRMAVVESDACGEPPGREGRAGDPPLGFLERDEIEMATEPQDLTFEIAVRKCPGVGTVIGHAVVEENGHRCAAFRHRAVISQPPRGPRGVVIRVEQEQSAGGKLLDVHCHVSGSSPLPVL